MKQVAGFAAMLFVILVVFKVVSFLSTLLFWLVFIIGIGIFLHVLVTA